MGTRKRIGIRDIGLIEAGQTIWDRDVPGFGARRQKSKAISYILFYRTGSNRQRLHTIGRHGAPWTPETARKEARKLLGNVADGADPSAEKKQKRHAASVAALCDLYFTDAENGRVLTRRKTPKKISTINTDRSRVERHIKPLLGRHTVSAVTRDDVENFMHQIAEGKTATRIKTGKVRGLANVRGGRGAATRTVGLLGAIFSYAVRHNMRGDNPVRGVERFADSHRRRRLREEEYEAVGDAIREAAHRKIWPPALAVTSFLLVTGWRTGEAIQLTWEEVDLTRRTATLGDTKTGHSIRPLSHAACEILEKQGRGRNLVFRASRGEGPMTGYPKLWTRIAEFGSVPPDITPHVFRHSFASMANDLGYSESTIAALIGHKGHSITSRYVHSADALLLAAADAVANNTLKLIGQLKSAAVIPLRRYADGGPAN